MKRILAIIMLLVLLLNGPHPKVERPLQRGVFRVGPRPIWVPIDLAARGYGPLRLFGVWQLQSDHNGFGGISALIVRADNKFTALGDNAVASDFGVGIDAGDATMTPLPLARRERREDWQAFDSESLARDPRTGRLWVGFEDGPAICRYSAGFERLEGCVEPPEMLGWGKRRSIESLVRLSDGRFLAIEEGRTGAGGRHDVLLWSGDPVDGRTGAPVHLSYEGPSGFAPTDALWLGGDRLLVLNRKLSLLGRGFTAKLELVRLPKLAAGVVLRGETITNFDSAGPVDNLEALALARETSGPVLWIASDDNHMLFQRSLLYRFSLPNAWVSDKPAP
jgi:hypothetical protein